MKPIQFILVITILSVAAATGSGQQVSYLNKGTVEGAVFGGFATGLGTTAGGVGGNIGVAANAYVLPFGEVTYFPSLSSTARLYQIANSNAVSSNSLTISDAKLSFTDIQGGVHLRAPNVFGKSNIMPYASIGAGVLHNGAFTGNLSGSINGIQLPSGSTYSIASENSFTVSFGGGIRYYTRNKVGFRFEVQGYKPTGSKFGNDPFVKVTFGVFFYANNK